MGKPIGKPEDNDWFNKERDGSISNAELLLVAKNIVGLTEKSKGK